MEKKKRILYVVPNIEKVSGGPRTRISMFKTVFLNHGGRVIDGKGKFKKAIGTKIGARVYVESATNRISLVDLLSLLYLKCISKQITVFVRDIYIELFPEEYASFRGRITMFFNKASNFFLTLISNKLAFPTEEMGKVFFKKNRWFPKKDYIALPPGCIGMTKKNFEVDFSKPLGVLYMGGISYPNSGFEHFLDFAQTYKEEYHFFVLSGDPLAMQLTKDKDYIVFDKVGHAEIPEFIARNNILVAVHSRPRNIYDDITFPIKVLDFVGMNLPFVTAPHKPLLDLLGPQYGLFVDIGNIEDIHRGIRYVQNKDYYTEITDYLKGVAIKNSYEERYKIIFEK